jgi:hypothetical protein
LLRVKSVKVNAGFKGKSFIAEFDVLQSEQQAGADGKILDPAGSIRSWVVPLENQQGKGSPFADIKGLAFAIMGYDPKTVGQPEENPKLHQEITQVVKVAVDADFAKSLGTSSDIFIGRLVGLQTHMKPTKPSPKNPAGGFFTVHNFFPVNQSDAANVAQGGTAPIVVAK